MVSAKGPEEFVEVLATARCSRLLDWDGSESDLANGESRGSIRWIGIGC